MPASPSALTIYTLGRFAVYRGDTLIAEWQRQKAKKLFKLLLLTAEHRLHKEQALEQLWPDKPIETAANNLNRTVFILRRVLQPELESAAQSFYLWFKDDFLCLNPASVAWIDADAFEKMIQLGRQQGHSLDYYNVALELYKGEFLPEDLYEEWTQQRRHILRRQYVEALKQTAALYTQQTAHQKAIATLNTLLHIEPADESAQRDLMRLYFLVGERHEAIRLYQQSSRILREELDVEPSYETTALYQAIIQEVTPLPPALNSFRKQGQPENSFLEDQAQIPLVGRRSEMDSLSAYLQRAQNRQGHVVFLVGEQGVGKTRIGEELTARAWAAGFNVLQGAAFEGEGRLLYTPFVGTLRRGLTPQLIDSIRQRLGPFANYLARLLPELVDSASNSQRPSEISPNRLNIETEEQERRRLFDAIATTYILFSQNAPVLVLLDNFHSVGESSLQLLHYLARQITHQRILFVCAVDQDRLHRGTPLALILSELQRHNLAQRLNVARLSQSEIVDLCARLLDDSVRDSNVPDSIYELTEGNPFFVIELILSLTKSGQLERRANTWYLDSKAPAVVPSSVKEAISARLGQLSDDACRLLGMSVAIGNTFAHSLLLTTTHWERSRLLDAVDELLREALIDATENGYRFRHAMIRQVVYGELSPERRSWLHEQVARALEAQAASQLDEHAAVLAFHYEQAKDYAAALRYLVLAGDWARRAYASREALEHYSHALTLGQQYPYVIAPDTLMALLERRAHLYLARSDFDSAIADLEQLLKTYQATGLRAKAGETLYQIGFAHYWAHRLLKASLFLDQALAESEMLDYHDLRNRVLHLRHILNSTQGAVADTMAAEASVSAESPSSLQAEEYWGYAMLAHLGYDFEAAHRHAQDCIRVGETSANTFLTLGGYFISGMSQASLGHYQTALDSLLNALKLSEATNDRFWRARLLNTTGWIYRDLFCFDNAMQYDRESLSLAQTSIPRLTEAEGNALANLATTCLMLKRYDAARAYVDEGLAMSGNEPFMRWRYLTRLLIAQGSLALAEDDLAEAVSAAEKALDLARNTKARKNIARSCLLRGQIHLAVGEVEKARAAMHYSLSMAQGLKSPGMIWPCHLALAELEEADDQPETAQTHYRAAREIVNQIVNQLADPALIQSFMNADPVCKVASHTLLPEQPVLQ